MQQLYLPIAIVVGVIILMAVAKLLATAAEERYPFKRREEFFSKGEREFFDALRVAVGNKYLIFSKVRLEDLVYLPEGVQDRMNWVNKVRQKHADFVLCSCDKISPVMVIELDDASHIDGHRAASLLVTTGNAVRW
jgi:hypothetical protein